MRTNKSVETAVTERNNMVDRIAQHKHCKYCDKAIPYKDEYCDSTCEKAWKSKMQNKKRQLLFFYIAMVVIMILAVALVFMGY